MTLYKIYYKYWITIRYISYNIYLHLYLLVMDKKIYIYYMHIFLYLHVLFIHQIYEDAHIDSIKKDFSIYY